MHPGNLDFWDVLNLCATQWLVGFGGPYGLNYVAISITAQALEIEVNRSFLEKLKYFERKVVEIMGEKTKPCDAAQKEKCTVEFGEHLKWACDNCKGKNGK